MTNLVDELKLAQIAKIQFEMGGGRYPRFIEFRKLFGGMIVGGVGLLAALHQYQTARTAEAEAVVAKTGEAKAKVALFEKQAETVEMRGAVQC